MTQAFDPDDFEWHDGNVVDLQLGGLAGGRQELRLTLDLFPSDDPQALRKRYVCVGNGLSRFLASGDVSRLVPGFRSSSYSSAASETNFENQKGTSKHTISSAAYRSEVPGMGSRQVVQELQIGGTCEAQFYRLVRRQYRFCTDGLCR